MTARRAFVPMFDPPRAGKQSARVGWIVAESGCHIWQGALNKGYGQVWVDGRMHFVHRVRYEREVGPIPEGMHLDHFFCDNGPGGCCNPAHVRPVTVRENTLRGSAQSAQNAAKTHCPRGHPLSGDNLYVMPPTGRRQCRACRQLREQGRAKRKRIRLFAEVGAVSAGAERKEGQ